MTQHRISASSASSVARIRDAPFAIVGEPLVMCSFSSLGCMLRPFGDDRRAIENAHHTSRCVETPPSSMGY